MDIRKLEAFVRVFEYCSFSKAGKALYLSQPTISAHVAALEQELGAVLFDRIGRMVVPTKAGEVLYAHAVKIFEISSEAISEIHRLQERVTGRLELGGSTIPANYILPAYLARFWKKYPDVILDLRIGDSEEIVAQMQEGKLMLGVVGGMFGGPELEYVPLVRDRLALVMVPALRDKYADGDAVSMVRNLPWVMREEGSGTRAAMDAALEHLGLEARALDNGHETSRRRKALRPVHIPNIHDALSYADIRRMLQPASQRESGATSGDSCLLPVHTVHATLPCNRLPLPQIRRHNRSVIPKPA